VVVGNQAAPGVAGVPVVEDVGAEGEESAGDAADETGEGAAPVAFRARAVFVEGGFDPLADAAEGAEAWSFVFAVGAKDGGAERVDELFELGAGVAFVADHRLARLEDTLEQLGGDDPLGLVGGRELEADRQPLGSAEEVEPEAPEPAAVAVAAVAGQL
jgi:hypothetical protein